MSVEEGDIAWEVARRVTDAAPSRACGIAIEDVGSGYAKLSMTVAEHMVNTAGITHGGFTFLFADTAFAVACNSYGEIVVARSCTIEFLAPSRVGERLIAEARERLRTGRKGIYDVSVTRDGDPIAEFRGICSGYAPRDTS